MEQELSYLQTLFVSKWTRPTILAQVFEILMRNFVNNHNELICQTIFLLELSKKTVYKISRLDSITFVVVVLIITTD